MCKVKSRENRTKKNKNKYSGQEKKQMDCDEAHLVPNEAI